MEDTDVTLAKMAAGQREYLAKFVAKARQNLYVFICIPMARADFATFKFSDSFKETFSI